MNTFVRLSGDLSVFEKSFFRNLVALIIAFAVLRKNHESVEIPKGTAVPLLLRAFFGTIGLVCNYYAVDHMIMSDASMLAKMSPFYSIILCYFILKEKVTAPQIGLMLVALAGSMLIVKPSAQIFSQPASLIAFIGGFCAACAYTMLRILGLKKVNSHVTVFIFSTFSCLSMIPFIAMDFTMPTLRQLVLLMLAGLTAAGGQYGLTYGYSFAPASEISIYDYSQVVFNALMGYLMFQQLADGYSMAGYVIIIGAAIVMGIYNDRRGRAEASRIPAK